MNEFFDKYEDESGYVDDKLTVSSEGFAEITDVLEDLFENLVFQEYRLMMILKMDWQNLMINQNMPLPKLELICSKLLIMQWID